MERVLVKVTDVLDDCVKPACLAPSIQNPMSLKVSGKLRTFSKAPRSHIMKHSVISYNAVEHLNMKVAQTGSSDVVLEMVKIPPT